MGVDNRNALTEHQAAIIIGVSCYCPGGIGHCLALAVGVVGVAYNPAFAVIDT